MDQSTDNLANKYSDHYFLHECNGYEHYSIDGEYLLPKRMQFAIKLLSAKDNDKVLDIGCGRGELIDFLARHKVNSIGMDFSTSAINISNTRRKYSCLEEVNYSIIKCNSMSLPIRTGSIDKVTMLDIVEHLLPDNLERTINEVHRILKDDGLLLIHTMPNGNYYKWGYPVYRFLKQIIGIHLPKDPRLQWGLGETHVNIQTASSIKRTLRQCGFSQIKIDIKQIEGSFMKRIISGNIFTKRFLGSDIYCVCRR